MTEVLRVEGLRVGYATEDGNVLVVDGLDLELHKGEFLGLAGESGSGKSTAALALVRLLRPPGFISGGRVLLGDDDILTMSDQQVRDIRWREVSMVMQNSLNALNPVARIERQLAEVLNRARPGERAAATPAELLDLVGIDRRRVRAYPHELSGGMRQRVAIAMALALRPRVVLMDEPTTALDVVVQHDIIGQVRELQAELGFAVLMITHDLPLLLETADRVSVMYAGRLAETAAAADFAGRQQHPYSRALVSAVPSLTGGPVRLAGLPGQPPDPSEPPTGCRFHPRCPLAEEICAVEQPPLVMLENGRRVACHVTTRIMEGSR
ncbi:ABC transporter ATP-binding protein [Kribbella sp. GL6]|uniref:ABC transporter ATP-binding protein n=1 Tax=Kribbella sp. GL6 TaxID=3419765 RepID=UPI003D002033